MKKALAAVARLAASHAAWCAGCVLGSVLLAAPVPAQAQVPAQGAGNDAALRPLLAVENGSHSAPVRRIDVSAARGLVVTAADDRTARVWDLASGALRHVLRPFAFGAEGGRLYGVAIHPQEPLVAVAGSTGGAVPGAVPGSAAHPHLIYLFDLDSGALRSTIDAKAGDIRKLAWSADGQVLFAGYNGSDGANQASPHGANETSTHGANETSTHGVRAFARDGRELLVDRTDGPVFGLATHASGLAAAVGLDGSLRLYRIAAGGRGVERAATANLGARRPAGIAFSPDGRQLAVAFATRREGVDLFDAATLQPLARIAAPDSYAGDWRVLAFSADGRTLALAGTAHSRDVRFAVVGIDVASRSAATRSEVAGDSITDLVALPGGGFAWASFDGSWGTVGVPGQAQPRRVGAPVLAVRGDAPFDLELAADGLAARWGQRGPQHGFAFAFEQRRLAVGQALADANALNLRVPATRTARLSVATDWLVDGKPPVIGGRAMALWPATNRRAPSSHSQANSRSSRPPW
ncbi:MAG: hypothetical protein U1F25_11695 [Rubrivivax sp.]